MLDPVQILASYYFFGGVGLGGVEKYRIRLNSAQLKLKLPIGAELGNMRTQNKYNNNIILQLASYSNVPLSMYSLLFSCSKTFLKRKIVYLITFGKEYFKSYF